MNNRLLKPLFKYPGGKSSEYKYLKKLFPKFDTYVEPFLGGGAVYWATDAKNWIINDFSQELISIYRFSQLQDELFLKYLDDIAQIWREKVLHVPAITELLFHDEKPSEALLNKISSCLLNSTQELPKNYKILFDCLNDSVIRKRKSLAKVAKKGKIKNWEENALGILGAALYTYLRNLYNQTTFEQSPQLKTVLYFFIREYAYSSMFRYNADGLFNVPFGGNTYAKKDFFQRLEQITSDKVIEKLQKTTIFQEDFSNALIDKDDILLCFWILYMIRNLAHIICMYLMLKNK